MQIFPAIALSLALLHIPGFALAYDAKKSARYVVPDMHQTNVDRLVISGDGSAIDPMRRLPVRTDLQGKRGPLFIWNDPTGNVPSGQSAGFQVWIGDNPTTTPSSGDTVAGTISVINGNGRKQLWGLNVFTQVCNTNICGAGYNDAATRAAEFEVGNGYPQTETNPWGGGFRKNGIEMTAQAGSVGRLTSAFMTWANDNTGKMWWNTGLALSRIYDIGILAQSNPSGVKSGGSPVSADATSAFKTAVLYDLSDSRSTIKIGPGSHLATIDMSSSTSPGFLVLGRQDKDSGYVFGNESDYNFNMIIDSGARISKQSLLSFSDRGASHWQVGKQADGSFIVYDAIAKTSVVSILSNSRTVTVPNFVATQTIVEPQSAPPASSSAPCITGQRTWDPHFEYRCIATNHWRRMEIIDF